MSVHAIEAATNSLLNTQLTRGDFLTAPIKLAQLEAARRVSKLLPHIDVPPTYDAGSLPPLPEGVTEVELDSMTRSLTLGEKGVMLDGETLSFIVASKNPSEVQLTRRVAEKFAGQDQLKLVVMNLLGKKKKPADEVLPDSMGSQSGPVAKDIVGEESQPNKDEMEARKGTLHIAVAESGVVATPTFIQRVDQDDNIYTLLAMGPHVPGSNAANQFGALVTLSTIFYPQTKQFRMWFSNFLFGPTELEAPYGETVSAQADRENLWDTLGRKVVVHPGEWATAGNLQPTKPISLSTTEHDPTGALIYHRALYTSFASRLGMDINNEVARSVGFLRDQNAADESGNSKALVLAQELPVAVSR